MRRFSLASAGALLTIRLCGCSAFGTEESTGAGAESGADAGSDAIDPLTGSPSALTFAIDPVEMVYVPQKGAVTIKVRGRRNPRWTSPVLLRVTGLREDVSAAEVTIPKESSETELTLSALASGAQGPTPSATLEAVDAYNPTFVLSTAKLAVFVKGLPGAIDMTFGMQGIRSPIFGVTDPYSSMQIAATLDDHILLAGTCALPPSNYCLARLSADGTFDSTYGDGGIRSYLFPGLAVAIQPDDKLLIAGGTTSPQIGRVDASGVPDPSFGDGSAGTGSRLAVPYWPAQHRELSNPVPPQIW
jgi:hypothetical protein